MKKLYWLIITILIISNLFIFIPKPTIASRSTFVFGNITSDTIWGIDNSPYIVINNVTVNEGVILTIELGVAIKFNPLTSLIINGTLLANGTQNNRIYFTSNQKSPEPADWSSITINKVENQSKSSIKYCKIDYSIIGILCDKSSPLINNNIITNIQNKGIYLKESNATIINNDIQNILNIGIDSRDSNPIIEDNKIFNCKYYHIRIYKSSSIIENNIISNGVNGIHSEQSSCIIQNNSISALQYAIQSENSYGVLISNNYIFNNSYGIYCSKNDFIIVNNTEILNSNFSIYSRLSKITICNSTISNSKFEDINLMTQSNLTSINTDFDDNKILISNNCTLIVKNYLNAKVINKNNLPISNAEIKIMDNDNQICKIKTNTSGICNRTLVTDRIYSGIEEAIENTTKVEVFYEELPFEDNPRYVDMSTSHTEIFKVKNIEPFINITSHSMNSEVSGIETLRGMTFDEDGYVETVEVRIDNGYWETTIDYSDNWSTWGYQWNTTLYPNGEHTISTRCKDNDDTYSTIFSIILKIDNGENMPPSITLTYPANNEIVKDIISIEGTATDDYPGFVKHVEVKIDLDAWNLAKSTNNDWSIWNYQWDTNMVSNGYHTIMVKGKDNFDAYSATISVRVYVYNNGNKPPEITINNPKDNDTVSGTIDIKGTTYDLDGEVQELEIKIDSNSWENVTSLRGNWLDWIYNLNTTKLSNGKHTIKVKAFDGFDITESTLSIYVKNYGNMPPQIYITSHRDDDTLKNIATIKGIANDTDGIVKEVKIQIDEGLWGLAIQTSPNWSTWCYYWNTLNTSDGEHTINLRSFDGELYSAPHTIIVYVNNEEPPPSPTPEPDGDENGDDETEDTILTISNEITWLLILISAILILILIMLILGYVKKKKTEEEGKEEEIEGEKQIGKKPITPKIMGKNKTVKTEKEESEIKKKDKKKPKVKKKKKKIVTPPIIVKKELPTEAKKKVRKKDDKKSKVKKKGKKKLPKPPDKVKQEKSNKKPRKKSTNKK